MMIFRMPALADEEALRVAHRELASEGHDGFLLNDFSEDDADFAGFIQSVSDYARGENLTQGHVTATFLIAEVDEEIVGRISVRHELNDFLENFGGHIGYMVRPSFRTMGYATRMLRHALEFCNDLGLKRVLITCDDDNLGSQRVIELNGGILENKVLHNQKWLRRYWIQIS
jgi:predicted acetyltransferase